MQWPPLANRNLSSVGIVLSRQTFCAIQLAQAMLLVARVATKYSTSFMCAFNLWTKPTVCIVSGQDAVRIKCTASSRRSDAVG